MSELDRIVEAILFVSEEPVTLEELAEVSERPKDEVLSALDRLDQSLDSDRGIELKQVAGGYRLYSQADMLPYLEPYEHAEDRQQRMYVGWTLEQLRRTQAQQVLDRRCPAAQPFAQQRRDHRVQFRF